MKGRKVISLGLIAIFAVPVVAQQATPVTKDLAKLADAEREFAATTVREGFRDGFIKYFADDGIGFGPHPERTKEVLQKRPAPTGPRTVIFNWAPMFGDISAAGDLGYTTGPVLFTDVTANPKPPRHGVYFSVWQKQADGAWKVVVDMGVDTPQAVAPIETSFTAATPVDKATKKLGKIEYREVDAHLSVELAKKMEYGSWLAKQFRIHRKGMMPITEATPLAPAIRQTKFEIIDGKIAKSNDLAFTYGKYTADNDTGYYVHVWRRNADGEWRLVADVQNPLPPAS